MQMYDAVEERIRDAELYFRMMEEADNVEDYSRWFGQSVVAIRSAAHILERVGRKEMRRPDNRALLPDFNNWWLEHEKALREDPVLSTIRRARDSDLKEGERPTTPTGMTISVWGTSSATGDRIQIMPERPAMYLRRQPESHLGQPVLPGPQSLILMGLSWVKARLDEARSRFPY